MTHRDVEPRRARVAARRRAAGHGRRRRARHRPRRPAALGSTRATAADVDRALGAAPAGRWPTSPPCSRRPPPTGSRTWPRAAHRHDRAALRAHGAPVRPALPVERVRLDVHLLRVLGRQRHRPPHARRPTRCVAEARGAAAPGLPPPAARRRRARPHRVARTTWSSACAPLAPDVPVARRSRCRCGTPRPTAGWSRPAARASSSTRRPTTAATYARRAPQGQEAQLRLAAGRARPRRGGGHAPARHRRPARPARRLAGRGAGRGRPRPGARAAVVAVRGHRSPCPGCGRRRAATSPPTRSATAEFVQLLCALRLLPARRRHHRCRPASRPRSATRSSASASPSMSAGSHTEPGGYAAPSDAEPQFEVSDDPSPAEVAAALRAAGYDPVWKDWQRT